ncbi:MAG: hypothetical protein R3F30_12895 [Planctomycetota bacterium]
MDELLDLLLDRWGDLARPPAGPAAIAAFEERYGVVLTPDFRAYLERCDGMEELSPDDDLISSWQLDRILPADEAGWSKGEVRGELGPEGRFFTFSDWALEAFGYQIELHDAPDRENRIVATTSLAPGSLLTPSSSSSDAT